MTDKWAKMSECINKKYLGEQRSCGGLNMSYKSVAHDKGIMEWEWDARKSSEV